MPAHALSTSQNSTIGRSISLRLRAVRGWFAALQAVAPALAERHATRIFFTPGRRRWEPGPLAGADPEPFHLRVGRDRVEGWSYGRGPTVLLVHGWGGCAGDWAALAERLVASGYRAVLADLPAHGRSGGKRTTLPQMARALHAIAHEAAFSSADPFEPLEAVVAHSFGAAAAALAVAEGLLTRSLVLVAPVAHPMTFVDSVVRALGLSPAIRAGMVERIRIVAGGDLSRIDVVRAAEKLLTRGLVVHDRDDATVPWSHARDISEAWTGARFVSTDGLGHRGVLRSEAVLDLLTGFVARGTASTESGPAERDRSVAVTTPPPPPRIVAAGGEPVRVSGSA
jgi:Serine aminopeptidase, S33